MPAPMARGPFPTTLELEGNPVRFHCRSQSYHGTVAKAERDEEGSLATVLLKLPCRPPSRAFALGELALLEALEESWTGTLAKSKESKAWSDEIDAAPLHTLVFVSVPDGGDCSGFPYDDLLTIYPTKPKESHLSFPLNKPSNAMRLRVGLIGFGSLGMHVVQALLDNEYIDLVAISIDSPPSDMLRAWKHSAISLRIKGPRTIIFKRLIMNVEEEVTVRVVRERVSWDGLSVDYVVDSLNILTDNKHVIHSMAYEGEGKAKSYSRVYDDNGVANPLPEVTDRMQVKLKCMKLLVTTTDALEAVVSNVAEWDREGDSARICFEADHNPTERICNPFTEQLDNNFLLGRSANVAGGGVDAISSVDAGDRISFLLRIFIDVIRRVPISGCHLEL